MRVNVQGESQYLAIYVCVRLKVLASHACASHILLHKVEWLFILPLAADIMVTCRKNGSVPHGGRSGIALEYR